MTDRKMEVVRQVVEHVWNHGDLDLADTLFDSDYTNHGGIISDLTHGPEVVKVSVALLRTAFPALHVAIDRLTAEGDTVELRWVATSTAGQVPVTGKRGRLAGTTLCHVVNGKILENWTDWDHAGVLQRLGIVPRGSAGMTVIFPCVPHTHANAAEAHASGRK